MKSNKPAVKNQHQTIHFQQQSHSGPLPAPHDFLQYDSINPGTAERILVMAEEEQRHRHALETAAAHDNRLLIRERQTGQIMAFLITVACLVLGAYLITKGFSVTGTILGTAGLVPVIYAFVPKKR